MSDNDTTGPGGTLINFPRIGFNLTPTTTMPAPPTHAPTVPAPTPSPAGARTGRLSPLDALAALPNPGLTRPVIPAPAPPTQPGNVPATFRSDPGNGAGPGTPGLGALSMAATLAVAVAALRGTHTVLSTWWENRQARLAEAAPLREARLKHQAAMQSIGDKAAQQRAKSSAKVPSSSEFGRKTLGNRSGGRSGSGSGSGGASGGRSGGAGRSGSGGSAGSAKKPGGGLSGRGNGSSPSPKGGLGSTGRGKNNGSALGGGARKNNGGTGTGGSGRGSQGGSPASLKKQHNKNNASGNGASSGSGGSNGSKKNSGSSGTGLGAALKKDTQKAAARRWKKRQKNGAATPALWGNGNTTKTPKTPNNPKTPKNAKATKNTPATSPKTNPGKSGNQTPTAAAGKTNGAGSQNTAQTGGRTTLAAALRKTAHRAARKRLKQRRRNGTPPIWPAPNTKQQQKPAGAGTTTPKPKVNLKKTKGAGTTPRQGAANGGRAGRQQQRKQSNRRWWAKARAYAQRKAAASGRFPGGTPGPGGAQGQGAAPGTGQTAGNPGPGAGAYVPPRGQRQRRSPYANAGAAAGTTYTVTSAHVPGSRAKRWQPGALTTGTPALPATGPAALNAAPTKTFPRPSSTRPKEAIPMPPAKPDARLAKARHQAARTGHGVVAGARHMDAQHETEITLDDAIDDYDDFKDDGFKTHDQCAKLADRAIRLRDILTDFSEELAVKHNLIGPLFSGAMARLAESMDLLARMAEEMKTSSLQAAEMAETAANDLNDAYRPYNTATADAGLSTPSAPIHNEA